MTVTASSGAGAARPLVTLGDLLREFRLAFAVVGVFSVCSSLLFLALPFYMINLFQRVVPNEAYATLLFLTLIVVGAFVVSGILDGLRSTVLARVGARLDQRISHRLFRSMHYTTRDRRADFSDAEKLRDFLGGGQIEPFFDFPFTPIFLGVVFLLHPVLGILGAIGAVLLTVLGIVQHVLTARADAAGQEARRGEQDFLSSSMRNLDAMEGLGMADRIRTRWLALHEDALARQTRVSSTILGLQAWTMPIRFIFQVAVLGTGAYLVVQEQITFGTMIAANILTMRAMMPAMQGITAWRSFLDTKDAYRRLQTIDAVDDTAPESAPALPERASLSLARAAVRVPETETEVVREVSFSLAPGDILGVVGPNGSGKSSLARGLVGAWPLAAGQVRLGERDVSALTDSQRADAIGYMPQDVQLFEGTVAENIRRFGPADDAGTVAAAQKVGVHELILRLPKTYDTALDPDGRPLTAGQRQRVGLARALYNAPRLLVLDEPDANLDNEGVEALVATIRAMAAAGTVVVLVTHSRELLRHTGYLLSLRGGRQADFGPTVQVLKRLKRQNVRPVPADRTAAETSDDA